jgi:hypothetical protein
MQNKMVIMGLQILSCHVPVVRSFFSSCKRCCYHLEIFHMITFLNILISSSIIPKSDLVLSHNSSRDVPISTSPVPKSHIVMSHNSSCYDPNINFSCPKKTHCYVPNSSRKDPKSTSPVPKITLFSTKIRPVMTISQLLLSQKVTLFCPIFYLVMM